MCILSTGSIIENQPKLPKDCSLVLRWHLVEKRTYPTAECHFGRLNKEEVLPILELPGIERLDLIWFDSCKPPYMELPDGSFLKMVNVFRLLLYGCIKSNFTSMTFAGLQKLEVLSIGMPGFEYGSDYVTSFEPDWLQPIQNLTLLYLTNMNAKNFPSGHFCGLQHLKFLNLSHNLINSTGGIGIQSHDFETSVDQGCLPSLTHLDVSSNAISILDITSLQHLQILYAQSCAISTIFFFFLVFFWFFYRSSSALHRRSST